MKITQTKSKARPLDYLAVRRMERKREQLKTVLDDILSVIPITDWRLVVSMSRQLVLSNGLLKGILEEKALSTVGDAFEPEFQGQDTAWAEKYALPYLQEWSQKAELRGILSFQDVQFQKSTEMDSSGDVFRILTKKRNGEAAIQLIKAHRVGQREVGDTILTGAFAGEQIENGVIMDKRTGEVLGYQILGDEETEDRVVPAGPMSQLIDPIFADQIRGLPACIAGLRSLVTSERIDENEEDFMEIVSRLFLIEKNPTGEAGPDFGGASPDLVGEEQAARPGVIEMWSGLAKIFQSGTDSGIEPFNPGDRPSDAFDRALDRRYRIICAGIGWPYELAWKLGELTSVGVHSVEQKARRAIRDRQSKIIPSAVEEIRWAVANAIEIGAIPFSKEWRQWGVTLPPVYSLNPSRAEESRRRDLELGLTTVGRILKAEGIQGGAKTLFRERATEIALKKEIKSEIEAKTGQQIEDWEMGRPPQGIALAKEEPKKTNDDEN
jgi:hypothetical protein